MGTLQNSEATRNKLLNAAGKLFAEKGFTAVTVREIVAQAQTHLSAMNYHFKSKDALYKAVLIDACHANAITPQEREYLGKFPPKQALMILIEEAIKGYRADRDIQWKTVLIAHEIRQPSHYFEEISQHYLKPELGYIASLIAQATQQSTDDHTVRFAAISLVGLIETFGLHTPYIDAVAPGLNDIYGTAQRLSRTILEMTLLAATKAD